MEVIITSKSRKHREKRKREHKRICLPSWVENWPSLGERATFYSTI